MSSQEDVVRKVLALWAKVDDPAASDAEKDSARTMAQKLMAKYAIDEMVLSEATETHEDVVIRDILIFETDLEDEAFAPAQRKLLAHYLAAFNRCSDIILDKPASIYPDGTEQKAGEYMTIFGFRSDTKLVEVLYSSLVSQMVVSLYQTAIPKLKKRQDREVATLNFCQGYVTEIGKRFRDMAAEVAKMAASGDGSLLPVLRSREAAVKDKFDEMYPPDTLHEVSLMDYQRYDAGANEAGRNAARNADLGGTKLSGRREAIGVGDDD